MAKAKIVTQSVFDDGCDEFRIDGEGNFIRSRGWDGDQTLVAADDMPLFMEWLTVEVAKRNLPDRGEPK